MRITAEQRQTKETKKKCDREGHISIGKISQYKTKKRVKIQNRTSALGGDKFLIHYILRNDSCKEITDRDLTGT